MVIQNTETPDPGVYENIDLETYLAWDAISSSRLKLVERSTAHYLAGSQTVESKALKLGALAHAGTLHPLTIPMRFAVMPEFEKDDANRTKPNKQNSLGDRTFSKSTSYYQQKKAQFVDANRGKRIVSETEYETILGMVSALTANPKAVEVLGGDGAVDVSILWEDPATGLLCKGRFDKLQPHQGRFAELKTTRDALNFSKDLVNLKYHCQLAFYQQGWNVLMGERLEPYLVAIETSRPFGNRAAKLCRELLEEGAREQSQLLQKLSESITQNSFTGYDNPDVWDGPSWYTQRRMAE